MTSKRMKISYPEIDLRQIIFYRNTFVIDMIKKIQHYTHTRVAGCGARFAKIIREAGVEAENVGDERSRMEKIIQGGSDH